MQSSALLPLFDDNELCDYLNTIIKSLDIKHDSSTAGINSCDLDKFCDVFSKIEQLACSIYQTDYLLHLLMHLPKLSCLNLYSSLHYFGNADSLQEEGRKLGIQLITDVSRGDWPPAPIWIIRNMY